MAKFLVTWEAGAFLGHQMLVSSASRLLAEAGHTVVVAAPEAAAPPAAQAANVEWRSDIPSVPSGLPRLNVPWDSRATSLWKIGFQSREVIIQRIQRWLGVFEHDKPDAVVLQAAPYAQVAARILGLRSVEFGIGFDVPPIGSPFVPFQGASVFDADQALRVEQAMVSTVVQAFPALADADSFASLVSGDIRLVTSIPELDHYAQALGRTFVGPLPLPLRGIAAPPWGNLKPRVLGYLRAASVDMPQMLRTIATVAGDAIMVCTDATPELIALATQLGVRMLPHPFDLGGLLASADLVVSHGGGLLTEALIRGRRCLVLPSHYEQFLAAKAAAQHRLAVVVNPAEPARWGRAFAQALGSIELGKSCSSLALKHAAHVSAPGAQFLAAFR